eukprot:gene11411-14524_t
MTPAHKTQIVMECQNREHIVCVTGSGMQDSPALRLADVGIAKNTASDVSRSVADVILLDNDFSKIVHGVETGRLKVENLRKAIAFILS